MLRYAISNLFPESCTASPEHLLPQVEAQLQRWLDQGVAFLQLREKSLSAGHQLAVATAASRWLRQLPAQSPRPRLLLNGRADVAAAAAVDGVHLTGAPGELRPDQARAVFRSAGLAHCLVSVSCHSIEDVTAARAGGADLILFAPVFEKVVNNDRVSTGQGLERLAQACRLAAPIPVLALGGVTPANTPDCLRAGAAGIAGIRLFANRS